MEEAAENFYQTIHKLYTQTGFSKIYAKLDFLPELSSVRIFKQSIVVMENTYIIYGIYQENANYILTAIYKNGNPEDIKDKPIEILFQEITENNGNLACSQSKVSLKGKELFRELNSRRITLEDRLKQPTKPLSDA